MSDFDHRDAGTPERAWRLDGVARLAPPAAGDRVVVLAAHPDDETLGAGGLVAECARRQVATVVVVASDGEASHPDSPTTTPGHLARVRRREVRAAVALLAPAAEVHFLALPDGALAGHRGNLLAGLDALAGGATHVLSPWSGDRHPDHAACADVAAAVAGRVGARHWQYPVWAWHWADPGTGDLPVGQLRRLELDRAVVERKHRALLCHRSQHAPLSAAAGDEAILPPAVLAHFLRPFECFLTGDPGGGGTEAAGRADVADGGPDDASRPGYFDDLYRRADDPWGLADRFYEQRKRALVMAALPRARFRRAFEPGCATGLLTEALAARCDAVVAWDVSARAVAQARARTAATTGVDVGPGRIPAQWPAGELDLVVLSEVGYYCPDLDALVARVLAGLAPDGVLVACHWRHPAPDHPWTAEQVHRALGARLASVATHVEADFLLDVWTRTGRSVAAADGIVG